MARRSLDPLPTIDECREYDDRVRGNGRAVTGFPGEDAVQEHARAVIRSLADVNAEDVEWLWPRRIPLGKLTTIFGLPGEGKSFITLDIAARVSQGRPWPDQRGVAVTRGGVLLMTCEDGIADTIVPRLKNAQAAMDYIHVLDGIRQPESEPGEVAAFSLDRDLRHLEHVLDVNRFIRLVVVDPITAFFGAGDSHKETEVRSVLGPLAMMAERRHVAVLAVMHCNKSIAQRAIHRASGSGAFIAQSRVAWLVSDDPNDPRRRLLLQVKNNLAPNPGGLAFGIVPPGLVYWEDGSVDTTADDAINPRPSGRPKVLGEECEQWLKQELADGPRLASDMLSKSARMGFSERTLKRAKQKVGVESRKKLLSESDNEKRWCWQIQGMSYTNNNGTSGTYGPPEGGEEGHKCQNVDVALDAAGDAVNAGDVPF